MRRNKIYELVVPLELKNAIDQIGFSDLQLTHVYNLIRLMLKDMNEEEYSTEFLPMPVKYWIKVFGSRYNEFLKPLKAAGIIEVQTRVFEGREIECYEVGRFCKKMRISPAYYSQNLVKVNYNDKNSSKDFLIINKRQFSKSIIQADLEELIVQKDKLLESMNNYIQTIGRNNFHVNDEITESGFQVENMRSGHFKLSSALRLAQKNKMNLIKDGKKYYLYNLENYIQEKKCKIKWSYTDNINRLSNRQYYFGRNSTNNRLDHNLTSLGKGLLNVIKADNNLVEIDLKNSQFAILSHTIKNDKTFSPTEDFEIFREQTRQGTLYEYIQQHFDFDDRETAKACMMELAFSSHDNRTRLKKKLRELFPTVVEYVDDFKKESVLKYGDEQHKRFAIKLQKEEAFIFIDNLYYNLKKKGLWVITKHDSLLVKSSDASNVRSYMEDYFKTINFHCSLK